MLQRYNNDFPRGEPLIQAKILTALANDIGAVIREHAALPRFRGMVLRWYADWSQLRDAELEFKEQCDKHARRVQADERLQDEAAGPPEDGWQFKAVVPPRDAKSWQVIGGWAPPDLAPEGFPEAPFPLPLPDCEITMPEKYAALSAVHDFAARGTRGHSRTKIAPWAGSPDVVGGVAFHSLVDCVKNIPESDEPHLRAILDEIRCDLRACAASTGKSGGVADQTTGGGEKGQVPRLEAAETSTLSVPLPTVAIAILFDEPEIRVEDLAKKLGVSAGTLYGKRGRWKKVRDTLIARSGKADAPRGRKDPDGTMEVWEKREADGES